MSYLSKWTSSSKPSHYLPESFNLYSVDADSTINVRELRQTLKDMSALINQLIEKVAFYEDVMID